MKKSHVSVAAMIAAVFLGACSNGYQIDASSCEFYGDTIWDKCWWFNNAWIFGIGVSGGLYFLGWKFLYDRDQEGKKFGNTFGGLLYFLIGTPVAMFGALLLTMLFEKMLTSS